MLLVEPNFLSFCRPKTHESRTYIDIDDTLENVREKIPKLIEPFKKLHQDRLNLNQKMENHDANVIENLKDTTANLIQLNFKGLFVRPFLTIRTSSF